MCFTERLAPSPGLLDCGRLDFSPTYPLLQLLQRLLSWWWWQWPCYHSTSSPVASLYRHPTHSLCARSTEASCCRPTVTRTCTIGCMPSTHSWLGPSGMSWAGRRTKKGNATRRPSRCPFPQGAGAYRALYSWGWDILGHAGTCLCVIAAHAIGHLEAGSNGLSQAPVNRCHPFHITDLMKGCRRLRCPPEALTHSISSLYESKGIKEDLGL